jgi:predicted dehydrogenase
VKKLGLGILGLGEGISLVRGSVGSERWGLRTVCDLDEALARSVADEFGCSWTTDLDEMCADDAIDCIAIYTPDPMHADHLMTVMQAGKHAICTKPLATDLSQAAELLARTEESGVRVLVGQSSRFFPSFERQRRDYEAGVPGVIRSVEAHYNGDKRGGTSGRWGKRGGNDWVFTGLAHPVDLAYWYLGPIETVFAAGVTSSASASRNGPTDVMHALLTSRSGAIGRVTGSYGTAHSHPDADPMIGCTIRGESGTLSARYPDFRYLTQVDGEGARAYNDIAEHAAYFPFGGSMHHVGEFRSYLEAMGAALQKGSEPRPNLQDGLWVVATLLAIRESIDTGDVISVPQVLARNGLEAFAERYRDEAPGNA